MAIFCNRCCGRHVAALLVLATAIPFSIILSLERAATAGKGSLKYRSGGWLRECAQWDPPRRRFLLSTFFDGGVSEIRLPATSSEGSDLQERTVIADADVAGNASVGIRIDGRRDRLLVVYADSLGFRSAAVAAYGLETGERFFLTQLSRPGDEPSYADDVAVDDDGNAYVTDTKSNKIWKVGLNGELLSIIRSDAFVQRKEWYRNIFGLNGIVYHPNGFLLVIHTFGGDLFRVDLPTNEVTAVRVSGSLLMGDGMLLLSPAKLVVAGTPSARIVESSDGWKTAAVTARYVGPMHRLATSATLAEGKVYISHLLGLGVTRRSHVLTLAEFKTL